MNFMNVGEQQSYEQAMTDYQHSMDVWQSVDPEDRVEEPQIPLMPAPYASNIANQPVIVQTYSGPAVAMPGTYVMDNGMRAMIVSPGDVENENLWAELL